MPAKKKDPSVRARRNKTATRATLSRVPAGTTNAIAYAALTVAQLREEIQRRNDDGRQVALATAGKKADLVARLVKDDRGVPDMPEHPLGWWHKQAVAWWDAVWTSPMAEQWDDSDVFNVFAVALLYNDIWTAQTAKQRKDALGEFRLQRADLGLSPYSRRRLEWTIETAAEAQDKGARRRRRQDPETGTGAAPAPGAAQAAGAAAASDPRVALTLA